jgi:hypothetical protein
MSNQLPERTAARQDREPVASMSCCCTVCRVYTGQVETSLTSEVWKSNREGKSLAVCELAVNSESWRAVELELELEAQTDPTLPCTHHGRSWQARRVALQSPNFDLVFQTSFAL